MTQLRPLAGSQRQRQRAEHGGEGRHHDRPEAQQARLGDRLARRQPLALGLEGEVDHHDRVLLDDADQQNDADRGDDGELDLEQLQRDQRADAGRRQGRQDRQRVDVALVENAEHDIDGEQGRAEQQRQRRLRLLEGGRRAGEHAAHRRGHADRRDSVGDLLLRLAQRMAGREVEGNGRGGEQTLVIDPQRRLAAAEARHRRQRDHRLG